MLHLVVGPWVIFLTVVFFFTYIKKIAIKNMCCFRKDTESTGHKAKVSFSVQILSDHSQDDFGASFKFVFILYWIIIDLQCCISFRYTAK